MSFPPHSQVPSPQRRVHLWQLEALRGLAAFYVLLHHISSSYLHLKHTVWGLPFRFGQEAVLVFFLLSGFVICYAHGAGDGPRHGFRNYLIKRGRRIYPIFILALLLAYVIQCLKAHTWVPINWGQLLGNLFMMQDHPERPGWSVTPFANNMPLWSLSFEWWFYMMFYPLNRWVPGPWQKYVVLGLSLTGMLINLVLPNCFGWFLVFFIIWWVGVEMAREFTDDDRVTWPRQKTMCLFLTLPMAWYGAISLQWWQHGQGLHPITYPLVEFRYFLMSLIFMALFFAWQKWRFWGFNGTIGRFCRLGSISYGLYLLHYPMLMDLRLLSGETYFYFDLGMRVTLAFILAWLVEGLGQKWINSATNRWLKSEKAKIEI